MRKNREQQVAKRNLDDLRERGTEAIGGDVMELLDKVMKDFDKTERMIMDEMNRRIKNRIKKKDGR